MIFLATKKNNKSGQIKNTKQHEIAFSKVVFEFEEIITSKYFIFYEFQNRHHTQENNLKYECNMKLFKKDQ